MKLTESNSVNLDKPLAESAVAPGECGSVPDGWRCFHCDEVFTDAEQAKNHFGVSQLSDPVCQVSPERLRELEALLRSYQEEDTDLHREIYGLNAKHATALMREEEKGYARGLRDAGLGMQPPNTTGQPNEQKSYVGNFGDTGEAQLRRELANVPLPNYMEGK